MMASFRLYLPSFYGDLRLEKQGTQTLLSYEKLSKTEEAALSKLETVAHKKEWATRGFPVGAASLTLEAPLSQVFKVLRQALKPGRKTVTAVRLAGGSLQEIESSEYLDYIAAPLPAVTVAQPTLGCPAPDFEQAELRATRVLEEFLEPAQLDDFRTYNRFVSRGRDTGHHYMVTSRHARGELHAFSRSLYDLDDRWPICAHDWEVPAAEEMLMFHVLLATGHEEFLRTLPEGHA